MPLRSTRRDLLKFMGAGGLLALAGLFPTGVLARAKLGPRRPFSLEMLREQARALAARPYAPPPISDAELLYSIDFDTIQKIRFRPEQALWSDPPSPFGVQLFHPHRFAQKPVRIYLVQAGEAREVPFSTDLFEYGTPGLAKKLAHHGGFAGFRVMDPAPARTDWLAFQGASYFRSCGPSGQYGLSARGIAVDTAMPRPEEFPDFIAFYLEQPVGDSITLYALLDGPSLSGVYRFVCRRADPVVTEVHAELFIRQDIGRLGVAPLTSMFWYGENNRQRAVDWRPEIHDSDGLALWTGAGERLWRVIENPALVKTSSFVDFNPRGFGLSQRDRDFDNYQDDGAFYDRRPSVWVEPLGEWGEGAVQLVEIPTDDEIHDNLVAYWTPKEPVRAGASWTFDYRLYWGNDEPLLPPVARVRHTWKGRPGIAGLAASQVAALPPGVKFVIDFAGGPLAGLEQRFDLEAVVTASRGRIDNSHVLKVVGTDRWRAAFDLYVDDASADNPVELRCYVRLGEKVLTETWLYQYIAARTC
ncbi:glucan biosynthesis protein [Immundisolibacter sp.]|uniref:glucan biosynthesis protein n=1 Tax=Immundisolibacter sp. TaxID=1934948 RepID=UPI002612287E|nr:glucan biosynthesis protein [Immundisolibacter sp.]MDD3650504.1 glucan biosynthesis protein [Immundisolibacter sp.]